MSESLPFISVIVPVFNDAERLRSCLAALAEQTYPLDRFEVIVVDNGSKVSPRALVESFPFCRFAEESKPGSYAARNHGLELAQGAVIAFTDSDCVPSREWLASGRRALADHPECGFIGGRIEIVPQQQQPTAFELYDMAFGLNQQNNVAQFQHAATANMMTNRRTFDRFGRFDDRVKSGGDFEWGQRVTAGGCPGEYAEAALVRHPARRTWSEVSRQRRRHAGGRFDRHATRDPYRYASRRFWRTAWKRFVPNIGRLLDARRRLRALGFGFIDWMRVSLVILALQYVTTFEFVRMWLGFSSERR